MNVYAAVFLSNSLNDHEGTIKVGHTICALFKVGLQLMIIFIVD